MHSYSVFISELNGSPSYASPALKLHACLVSKNAFPSRIQQPLTQGLSAIFKSTQLLSFSESSTNLTFSPEHFLGVDIGVHVPKSSSIQQPKLHSLVASQLVDKYGTAQISSISVFTVIWHVAPSFVKGQQYDAISPVNSIPFSSKISCAATFGIKFRFLAKEPKSKTTLSKKPSLSFSFNL